MRSEHPSTRSCAGGGSMCGSVRTKPRVFFHLPDLCHGSHLRELWHEVIQGPLVGMNHIRNDVLGFGASAEVAPQSVVILNLQLFYAILRKYRAAAKSPERKPNLFSRWKL